MGVSFLRWWYRGSAGWWTEWDGAGERYRTNGRRHNWQWMDQAQGLCGEDRGLVHNGVQGKQHSDGMGRHSGAVCIYLSFLAHLHHG